jgi:hypothetical protein
MQTPGSCRLVASLRLPRHTGRRASSDAGRVQVVQGREPRQKRLLAATWKLSNQLFLVRHMAIVDVEV